MNTKQVEELVGMSRQNIRYYEKAGLLLPKREEQNSYRDYAEEDIARLKWIKMLRLLDMPLKEQEEEEKLLVFYTDCKIHTFGDFEKVLKEYAKTLDKKFKVKERGKYSKFYLNDEFYQAVYSFENPGYRIVCMKIKEVKKEELFLKLAYRKVLVAVYTMFANIRRHAMKSVCNFIISSLLVILLGIYIGNWGQIKIQIEELPDATPVYGIIYNETGSASRHLLIKESVVDGIRKSVYTDEIRETVELIAKTNAEDNYRVLALQDHELDSLQPGQCIVNQDFLNANELKVGDEINVSVYCYIADIMLGGLTEHFMADVKWKIVESREMEEDLHIPLKDAKELFVESK